MSGLDEWFLELEDGRKSALIGDKWMLAKASWEEARKQVLEDIAECDCMGEVSKVLRQYGIN